jgi:hypothetical protein
MRIDTEDDSRRRKPRSRRRTQLSLEELKDEIKLWVESHILSTFEIIWLTFSTSFGKVHVQVCSASIL